jgi:hypothetical protein
LLETGSRALSAVCDNKTISAHRDVLVFPSFPLKQRGNYMKLR